jgi:hypothetical protein
MKIRLLVVAVLIFLVLPVGCKEAPPDPNAPYIAAINAYWRVHPRCLWTQAVRMPAEEMPKGARISGFQALTDMGFLQPAQPTGDGGAPAVKGILAFDLTDQGRTSWVPVPHMKGLGNLCYGHRSVTTVDNVVPIPASQSAMEAVVVKYHFSSTDQPQWATDPKLQAAFPEVTTTLAQQADTATLIKTSSGWVLTTETLAAPAPRKKSHLAAPAKDPWAASPQ